MGAAPGGTVPVRGRAMLPKHDAGDGFLARHLLSAVIKALASGLYNDLAAMEARLADQALDWTVDTVPAADRWANDGCIFGRRMDVTSGQVCAYREPTSHISCWMQPVVKTLTGR